MKRKAATRRSVTPKNCKLVDTLFVGSSGFGEDDEPAMSVRHLNAKLLELQRSDKTYGYAIVGAGPFQLHLGVFERRKYRSLGDKVATKAAVIAMLIAGVVTSAFAHLGDTAEQEQEHFFDQPYKRYADKNGLLNTNLSEADCEKAHLEVVGLEFHHNGWNVQDPGGKFRPVPGMAAAMGSPFSCLPRLCSSDQPPSGLRQRPLARRDLLRPTAISIEGGIYC